MEKISGPFSIFYIAAKSERIEKHWIAKAKVFVNKPSAFDDKNSVAKFDVGTMNDELEAVKNVEHVAKEWIGEQQDKLSVQFELAKTVYALHMLLQRHPHNANVNNKLKNSVEEFKNSGGVVKTGIGSFDAGPALETSMGTEIPYTVGRILAEDGQLLGQ